MLSYPDINPIALSIPGFELMGRDFGPFNVHWYGIMYLCAFASAWALAVYRARRPGSVITVPQVENLITYGAFGVIIGGRCGYVFFYGFDQFLADPLWLVRIWEGGMSFHGGLIGVIVAMLIYARRLKISYLKLMDFVAPIVPLGLGFGRLGNFIGQELWGRVSDAPWAMVFPKAMDPAGIARHPSQLYQAFLEGLVLFLIVFWFSSRPRPRAAVCGVFLVFYAIFRFSVEFVREPDEGVGFVLLGWMTRGQELCIPMFLLGIGLLVYAYIYSPDKVVSGTGKN
ncbi:prolipoprotein diacylglyceryl transferase [Cellvibrio japonicus]|nr:prolipoprotein diacylglyceryl transferase [Cellvibrio japonicus]QEI11166.1 prolipoprotein diacylglyceryl transferase [Cellvibrio japonicus]QEI14740.1 prolipoprotein diacylglyceryl transferase [Cellvibrio japonicus]QEI18320.1 prolipoprotein diacylglyceryl transferase [Cellvibrio japonicus]